MASVTRLPLLVFLCLIVQFLSLGVSAADCSKTNLCKIGCCSKDGFCGTTSEHCGSGCQSTCDYKPPPTECSATKLCATGCCSEHGFCGTTEEHCGKGCQSTCDFKLGCDKNNPCKDGTCCSKFGFCGFGPDYCSKDNCVAGCDAKTFCDPGGYGPEFAEHSKCPLNVCCSKWGYCGLTEEFCGNKEVTRPHCTNKDGPMKRVVGYYEGWATERACDQFKPSDIPDGVYTHINFAFASIDPNTFKIVPAAKGDPDLYKQVVRKKEVDPNLKVFIAIGGWAFNDPGPTATTFSDIARSETNQRTFISSLISFINAYGFDGVDIDWEYPEAPDRQGRGEDFANLPKFLSNLRTALRQNGDRNGLSIAIPASYWYLQHFDIVKIAKYVDYFNVMTYDFHGSWDTPESWLGSHLNSHTNLTEIADALDLLWRNDINPDQVNLGLAFYSRTFTASSESCMSPGCLFDSGAPAGLCSNAVGVLSNAEISRQLPQSPSEVILDKEAAVKIFKDGRSWITFDDEETWKLKLDFARSRCLGGAMVWAVSHDTLDGKYSKQLQSVTGYKSDAVLSFTENYVVTAGVFIERSSYEASLEIDQPQCHWTNCGQECPTGWQHVKRTDKFRNSDSERMWDDTGCFGPSSRRFCCPRGEQPRCGWLSSNGGNCMPGCTSSDQVEIGSVSSGCTNGKWQSACCSGDMPSMDIWRQCQWYGTGPKCAHSQGCDWSDKYSSILSLSEWGSGDELCRDSKGRSGPRPYCCDDSSTSNAQWDNCVWSEGVHAADDPDYFCSGGCPEGKLKVTLDLLGGKSEKCLFRSDALCCDAKVTLTNEQLKEKKRELLRAWVNNPTCPNPAKILSGRQLTLDQQEDPLTQVKRRSEDEDESIEEDVEEWIRKAIDSPFKSSGLQYVEEIIDPVIVARWENLGAGVLNNIFYPIYHNLRDGKNLKKWLVWSIMCIMEKLNKSAGSETETETISLNCPLPALKDIEPALVQDTELKPIDDNSTTISTDEDVIWVGLKTLQDFRDRFSIQPRVGKTRDFEVHCPTSTFTITSETYPNGKKGDALAKANLDKDRWYVDNSKGSCYLSNVQPNGGRLDEKWVSEHILELQTFRNFIEFTVQGKLGQKAGSKYSPMLLALPSNFPLVKCDIWSYEFRNGFSEWYKRHNVSPMKHLFRLMGSVKTPNDMVNCEHKLNNMKEHVWGLKDAIGAPNWDKNCAGMTKLDAERAITSIEMNFGVWQYLNHPTIQGKMINVYNEIRSFLIEFEDLLRKQDPTVPRMYLAQRYWPTYMKQHFNRMLVRNKAWASGRMANLIADWAKHGAEATQQMVGANQAVMTKLDNEVQLAKRVIEHVELFAKRIDTTFSYDTRVFK